MWNLYNKHVWRFVDLCCAMCMYSPDDEQEYSLNIKISLFFFDTAAFCKSWFSAAHVCAVWSFSHRLNIHELYRWRKYIRVTQKSYTELGGCERQVEHYVLCNELIFYDGCIKWEDIQCGVYVELRAMRVSSIVFDWRALSHRGHTMELTHLNNAHDILMYSNHSLRIMHRFQPYHRAELHINWCSEMSQLAWSLPPMTSTLILFEKLSITATINSIIVKFHNFMVLLRWMQQRRENSKTLSSRCSDGSS